MLLLFLFILDLNLNLKRRCAMFIWLSFGELQNNFFQPTFIVMPSAFVFIILYQQVYVGLGTIKAFIVYGHKECMLGHF